MDDKNCHHFVMTPLESHDEDSLSQSTGSYSVKLAAATAPLTEDDLNVVKKTTTGLEHVSISYSRDSNVNLFVFHIYSSP